MNELEKILEKALPDVDFDKEKDLVNDGILDSVIMVSLIAEIEDAFEIEIPMEYIDAEHFASKEKIYEMIGELQ